jgi:Protein of unknown function (DUF3168)
MKDIRLALRQLLISNTAVNAICQGRVYPTKLPQGIRAPSLVYFRIVDFSSYHYLGDGGLQRIYMQIDSWGEHADQSVSLADAAHDCLSGFKGRQAYIPNGPNDFVDIQAIFHHNGRDLADDVTQMFRMSRDYLMAYAAS